MYLFPIEFYELKRDIIAIYKSKSALPVNFSWQEGYGGIFIQQVGHSCCNRIIIKNQEIHHKKKGLRYDYL